MRWLLLTWALLGLHCAPHSDDDDAQDYYADKNLTLEATSDGGSFVLEYQPDPDPIPQDATFSMDLQVYEADGASPSDATVLVDANMPAHGHGMTVVPVAEGGEGQWTVAPMLFHMTGHWQITVDIDGPAGWEQAVFDVRCCD